MVAEWPNRICGSSAYMCTRRLRQATLRAMRFELHCHSPCSDGTEPPEQVAARAAQREVAVFALTDHDTCAGSAVDVAGARVLRAVEISCDEPETGRTIHVLAYDRGGAGWTD